MDVDVFSVNLHTTKGEGLAKTGAHTFCCELGGTLPFSPLPLSGCVAPPKVGSMGLVSAIAADPASTRPFFSQLENRVPSKLGKGREVWMFACIF
jgi:hypothetical protein